jgi:hypothetical protein
MLVRLHVGVRKLWRTARLDLSNTQVIGMGKHAKRSDESEGAGGECEGACVPL